MNWGTLTRTISRRYRTRGTLLTSIPLVTPRSRAQGPTRTTERYERAGRGKRREERRGDRERRAHRAAAHRPTKPRATPPQRWEKPAGLARRGDETVAVAVAARGSCHRRPARSGCLGGGRGKRKREETEENGGGARPRPAGGTHTWFGRRDVTPGGCFDQTAAAVPSPHSATNRAVRLRSPRLQKPVRRHLMVGPWDGRRRNACSVSLYFFRLEL